MNDFVYHEEKGILTLDGRVLTAAESIEWLEWFGVEVGNKKMGEFIYDENHKNHTLNGKKIGSVSNIVEPVSMDYSKAHPGKLWHKSDLGTAFHECIHLFLANDLDEDSIDDELILPMQQFKEFWTDDEFKGLPSPTIIAIEQPFCNEKLKYCGKPDLITEDCIYDWKLRKFDPVCDPLRMAGYAGLVNDFPPKRKVVVEFSLDSGYRVHDADKKQACPMFRKLLEFYWKKQEFENLCENWRKSI